MKIKNGKVYRGGLTAPSYNREETDLIARRVSGSGEDFVAFEANIASKGGGVTQVSLRVPISQLVSLIDLVDDPDQSTFPGDLARSSLKELVRTSETVWQ